MLKKVIIFKIAKHISWFIMYEIEFFGAFCIAGLFFGWTFFIPYFLGWQSLVGISFIISIIILVVLGFIFYKKK